MAKAIGNKLNLNGGGYVTFYDGNEDQEPPAAIEELSGVGQTSAYRGQFLAVFTNFPRESREDKIPHLSFECIADDPGDVSATNRFGSEILQLIARFRSEPDRLRGRKNLQHVSDGGKAKGDLTKGEREEWQRRAEEIWTRRPNLTKRTVADLIDRDRFETIRKVIKRPTKA